MLFDQEELVLGRPTDLDGIKRYLLRPGEEHFDERWVQRMTSYARVLMEEVSAKMQPGDELRFCRSAAYDPACFHGHDGLAIVRAGVIVEYRMVMQY